MIMGRARSNMEFIENEKVRVTTYRRRKKSLIEKATQLATLCDIQVCIIMSGPNLSDNAPKPLEAWSENPKEPAVVIQNFKNAIKNKKHRDITVSDVLNKKPKTAANNNDDDNINNVRFWYERAKKLSLPQLEELLESITAKLRQISVIEEDRRVHFVKFMFPNSFEMSPYTYDPNANAIQEEYRVNMGNFMLPGKFDGGPGTYGQNVNALQEDCNVSSGNFAGPNIYGKNVNVVQTDRRVNLGNFILHDKFEAGPTTTIQEDRRVSSGIFKFPYKLEAGLNTYGRNVNADRSVSTDNFKFPYKLKACPNTYGRNVNVVQENCKVNLADFTYPDELEVGPGTFDLNFIVSPLNHHPYAYQMPPSRPHDHSNPIGQFTNAMTSDDSDFNVQFTDQGVSFNDEASSSIYIPYNAPQYNEIPNFLDLSVGLTNNNNNNDNNQVVQNPNATMWYLSTEQFEDAKREAKFGGLNG